MLFAGKILCVYLIVGGCLAAEYKRIPSLGRLAMVVFFPWAVPLGKSWEQIHRKGLRLFHLIREAIDLIVSALLISGFIYIFVSDERDEAFLVVIFWAFVIAMAYGAFLWFVEWMDRW